MDQAKKRQLNLGDSTRSHSTGDIAELVKIPHMNYLEINVNGKGFERTLVWKLSYWNIACGPTFLYRTRYMLTLGSSKLVTLMTLGYRIEAISILGREVMLPRGLIGLGFDSIDVCGAEITEVGIHYHLHCPN
jgi:protein-tyrosine phosphatase